MLKVFFIVSSYLFCLGGLVTLKYATEWVLGRDEVLWLEGKCAKPENCALRD